ncbi:MAG: hypothetical protein CL930_09925 [Deltaproteobacteria bacterium]|nr:hypothetical protein [Deltaproteobacteria bacterium]
MRKIMLFALITVGCGDKATVSIDLNEAEADCTWYQDADGDGYANPFDSVEGDCDGAPEGAMAATEGMWDCDDESADNNPDAAEVCDDEVDNNCDGQVDEDCEVVADDTGETDADADGDDTGTTGDDTGSTGDDTGTTGDDGDDTGTTGDDGDDTGTTDDDGDDTGTTGEVDDTGTDAGDPTSSD